jgi:hypothetical protein
MADLMKLAAEWPIVKAAPLTFIAAVLSALLVLIPIIWLVVSLLKSEQLAGKDAQIATKSAEIGFLQRQLSEYQEKLKVGSPDEAMQKLAELERFAPRQLRLDQKEAIQSTFKPQYSYRWSIQIYYYRTCYDCSDYARQISFILQKEKSGNVGGPSDFAGGDFDDKAGLVLGVVDASNPPPIALLLAKALTAAKIDYEFRKTPFGTSEKAVDLLILPAHRA